MLPYLFKNGLLIFHLSFGSFYLIFGMRTKPGMAIFYLMVLYIIFLWLGERALWFLNERFSFDFIFINVFLIIVMTIIKIFSYFLLNLHSCFIAFASLRIGLGIGIVNIIIDFALMKWFSTANGQYGNLSYNFLFFGFHLLHRFLLLMLSHLIRCCHILCL